MRDAVSVAALFFALAGTGIAAGRLVTGADVRDGSLTARDFTGLRTQDAARSARRGPQGRRGPTGPAGIPGPASVPSLPGGYGRLGRDLEVAADGTVTGGSATDVQVAHPATGVYCVDQYDSHVIASSADVGAPKLIAADALRDAGSLCGQRIQVRVWAPDGVPADGGFRLLLR